MVGRLPVKIKLARELANQANGFFHQPLGAGNAFPEALHIAGGGFFQRQKMNIDSQQSLGDVILQFEIEFPLLSNRLCQPEPRP